MTVIIQDRILSQCQLVLYKAASLFPHLDFRAVAVKFNLKGHQIGQARNAFGEYSIRFNMGYAESNIDHLINDTVPHEIAHIVCFMDDSLGYCHDDGWKRVCYLLGGTAKTLHPIPKIFCKGRTFEYITTTGVDVRVSEHMHIKIQNGAAYRYSIIDGDVDTSCKFRVL